MRRGTQLPEIKAVITDYIGTLANARSYTMEASLEKLHGTLVKAGFPVEKENFLVAYGKAHEKYRIIRYCELREVTNAVWVSEALCSLGFDARVEDSRMNMALNVFFEDYIDSLELRPCAEKLLKKARETCKLGLISNFTYAPVVHKSLRRLGISGYFDVIVVSGDSGWRKPHRHIFEDALKRLGVKGEEAIFIGDCPLEDIKGAIDAGLKAVFVHSQFYDISDLKSSGQKPDFVATDLEQICRNFEQISISKTDGSRKSKTV
jgi:HAD superfamily hydrolase (TIGR01509 family)